MHVSNLGAEANGSEIVIHAKLLIPGRGQPIPNAVVGISTTNKTITYVGEQHALPRRLANAPRIQVGYLLPGLWDCHTFCRRDKGRLSKHDSEYPALAGPLLPAGLTTLQRPASQACATKGSSPSRPV